MSVAAFVRAAHLDDVEPGVPLGVILEDGRRLCLVRDGETVYAVDDRCPHRDFALSGGDVVAPCVLECPWHGAHFDVRTGAVLQGPATDPIACYKVRIADGEILVGERMS
jgi:3-phenylpropionate/trans-cinnamate dioxygenase ferredoxin subunit